MASGNSSHRRVEPSRSVKTNVTGPEIASCTTAGYGVASRSCRELGEPIRHRGARPIRHLADLGDQPEELATRDHLGVTGVVVTTVAVRGRPVSSAISPM